MEIWSFDTARGEVEYVLVSLCRHRLEWYRAGEVVVVGENFSREKRSSLLLPSRSTFSLGQLPDRPWLTCIQH